MRFVFNKIHESHFLQKIIMNKITLVSLLILISMHFIVCKNQAKENKDDIETMIEFPKQIYSSDSLIIEQLSPNTYLHTTFMVVKEYGKVSCNGMIIVRNGESVIVDIPADTKSSQLLIEWIYNNIAKKINAVVITHFHKDSSGGLQAFTEEKIHSYATNQTINLLKKKNVTHLPHEGFDEYKEIEVGDDIVIVKYFGEGHTADNIIGYYSRDQILFGGCLVKELEGSKGNLEDANTNVWPSTIQKILSEYPEVTIVIPGHGNVGGKELLEYTMKLFSEEKDK